MNATGLTAAGRASAAWRANRQFLRFVLAAGASVPVNLLSRVALSHWLPFGVAVLISHGVGMVTAYVLTRLFVFSASGRTVKSELGRFAVVNVFSAAITWCISVALVDVVFPRLRVDFHPELMAHLIGLGVASVTSFIGHSRFSFRRSA